MQLNKRGDRRLTRVEWAGGMGDPGKEGLVSEEEERREDRGMVDGVIEGEEEEDHHHHRGRGLTGTRGMMVA